MSTTDFKQFLNIYEFETTLPGSNQVINFKPITTGELKKLLVYEKEDDERVIENALDNLISSSVNTEGFNIKDLYLQDRFFLLVEIRKKTKGESYKFTYECSDCKSQSLQNVDLNSLEVKKLNDIIDNNIQLTNDISVKVKHITRNEQIEAQNVLNVKNLTPLQRATEISLFTHAAGIESITTPNGTDTEVSIQDKKFLLENIPTGSYEKLKKWHEDNDFGLIFKINIKCFNCKKEENLDIPLNNFFF